MRSKDRPGQESSGLSHSDREQMLLDDLRAELSRLADAVERQNELLADRNNGEVTPANE